MATQITPSAHPLHLNAIQTMLSSIRRAMLLVWQSSPVYVILIAVLTTASATFTVMAAWAGKMIVDTVVAENGTRLESTHSAWICLRWVFLEFLLIGALSLTDRASVAVRQIVGLRISNHVRERIAQKALNLELGHFERPELHDRIARARGEASSRPLLIVQQIMQIARGALTFAGYGAVLVSSTTWFPVLLIVSCVPSFMAETRFSGQMFQLRYRRSPEMRRLNYLEYLLTSGDHAKEVGLFGFGHFLLGRFRDLATNIYNQEGKLARRGALWAAPLSLVTVCAFYSCYATVVMQAAFGLITIGTMTFYLIAFRQGQSAVQSILTGIGGLYDGHLYLNNLFSFLDTPTELPIRSPPTKSCSERGIRFRKVSFRYTDSEKWIFQDLSVWIPYGTTVALVGANGAGKSTFVKLLLRFYDPNDGQVLVDGIDVREWNLAELRLKITGIFQDFSRYHLSVRENVALGNIPHLHDVSRIFAAAEDSGARSFIDGLEQGLDTQLGRKLQEGVELSGGQWQKLAIARAFMRDDAEIIILDEPTASTDAESEFEIFERFRKLRKGRTAILISHRFPTVRMADRILVLDHGQIVEDGSHNELLSNRGRYARLFTLQARGYQ